MTNIVLLDMYVNIDGSNDGLSPVKHQSIVLTSTGLFLIGPFGINVNESRIKI